jgi:PAS domain S-box-containing protein
MKNLQLKSKIIGNFLKLCNCGFANRKDNITPNVKILTLIDNIFTFTPSLISFVDTDFKYLMCSKKYFEMFDIPSKDMIFGKSYADIYPKEQLEEVKYYLESVVKGRKSKIYIQRIEINGREFLFERVSSPLILKKKVVGILTLSSNITELIYMRKSLETSVRTLYALINDAPYIAYVMDKKGAFINGNAQAKKLFENGVDEIDYGREIQLDMTSSEFLDTLVRENFVLLKSGESLNIERQLKSVTGEKYWYKITKSPIKNAEGEYYAVVTFLKNINTEKLAQEQRETYIATLSHDLKTPAIAQVRALELLLSGQFGEFNDEQKEMLEMTLESCNYLYEMVYTLLSTCKLENGFLVLNYSSFDIVAMACECIHEVSNLCNENFINIEFEPKVEKCFIDADKIEMKRVIINLLSNAIKYAFPSSNINVSLSVKNNNVELLVKNSSPYIEPVALERLFGKYVTNSDKFNKVGFGLGLYLSKKIVEKHKGNIIAESFKSQNNIFGFSIPIKSEKSLVGSINK